MRIRTSKAWPLLRQQRGALAWVALGAILLLLGWRVAAPVDAAALAPPKPSAVAALAAPPAVAWPPSAPVAAAEAPVPSLPSCPHQQLDVRGEQGLQRECVSATRTRQMGSVRRYVVEAEGVSSARLSVDVVAGKPRAVRLVHAAVGTAPALQYGCKGAACEGVSLGAPDSNGVRALALRDTALTLRPVDSAAVAVASAVSSGQARVVLRVTASLRTEPDRNDPALACVGHGVGVVESGGAVIDFCALGGAGFEVGDDGQLHFAFRDLEGRDLVVTLATDRSIARVRLGALACAAPQCGGVSMAVVGDAVDPEVERRFSFSGTTLTPARQGEPTATLSGALTMPSQR